MTSKELNVKLITFLPELKAAYQDEVSWQEGDDTGSHIVFEDVLLPYLLEQLERGRKETVKRIFDTIEHLLTLRDEYVENVIALSFLEGLFYEPQAAKACRAFMGEKTEKMFCTF